MEHVNMRSRRPPKVVFSQAGLLMAAALWSVPCWSQTALSFSRPGLVRIINDDVAVLESVENRADLPCRVDPVEPELGFDMRFHAGYSVSIPLRNLAGAGDQLRLLMRISPLEKPERQLYLVDRFSVPPIEEDAKGEASLPGRYTLGPGRYKVDWLMRNRAERVCSAHWEIEADLDEDDRAQPLTLPANTVAQRPDDPFEEQHPVPRAEPNQLAHLKILVNFSPADPSESALKPWDVEAIVAMLRNIAREPQVGRFSVVAFNMQQEQVIYRADNVERLDFPALGDAVSNIKLGVIDYRRLLDPHSATRFLTTLLTEQLGPQHPEPDAIVIVGPKLMLDKNIPQEALRQAGTANCPIFYLNYNSNPRKNPWRDAIGVALKVYRGFEYSIRAPRDLGAALSDMMFRLRSR